jgi:uncharacterized protein (DUF2236 family)
VPSPSASSAGGDRRPDTAPAERPLVRELAEWRLLVPFAGRVLALQGSHPTVAAGVYQHSELFSDPWRRARRTLRYGQRLMFGRHRSEVAAEIRELHRAVKGTGFDGRPYHAWNREAWTWVHLTTFEATLFALEKIHGPLPGTDLEALYAEAREVGRLYGVRSQDMPGDLDGLRAYVEEGIETKLTHRPVVDLVPSLRQVPAPPWVPVPGPLWRTALQPAAHGAHIALAGSFPPVVRRRWGIRWSALHELEYQALLAALRTVPVALPDRLRMLPYPYRMLHRRVPAPA